MNQVLKARREREAFAREHRALQRSNERSRVSLEVPLEYAAAWRVAIVNGHGDEVVKGLEDQIRALARADWGDGTLVLFRRKTASVTFTHADGRKIMFPVSKQQPSQRSESNV